MEYYLAIKKEEIISFSGKWMELESFSCQVTLTLLRKANITCFLSYEESRFFFKDMEVEGGLFGKRRMNIIKVHFIHM
jgi:hypothetical protein